MPGPYTAPMTTAPRTPILRLLSLAALAVLVHGYHLGADDAAIYVPAIKKVADPGLYPFGSEFFVSYSHLSFFADLVGDSARLTRLPTDFTIFAWHAASIFLLLLAAWRLAGACFRDEAARWGGVALLAALLSVPVAGTALVIMDPYLTARSLSTPATLFAVACCVSNRWKEALAWLLFTALMHPLMSVYPAVFLGCFAAARRLAGPTDKALASSLAGIPFLVPFEPAHGPAREALFSRSYLFVFRWQWYEWVGVFAPLGLLWWFSSLTGKSAKPALRRVARSLVPFGLLFTIAGVVVGIPAYLENYTRLQPMRAFLLVYIVFFVLMGGLIQQYALRRSVWRWLGLFIPLAVGMWFLQWSAFPASPHVELPGVRSGDAWPSAFLWIRDHTPKDAVFALDPDYMLRPGEDIHGFRAVAERSQLADRVKDSGAALLFPQVAEDWKSQTQAASGWEKFQLRDFQKLAAEYPVTWIVTESPGPSGATCPYRNRDLAVCRISD
jgi:hypothetical protein